MIFNLQTNFVWLTIVFNSFGRVFANQEDLNFVTDHDGSNMTDKIHADKDNNNRVTCSVDHAISNLNEILHCEVIDGNFIIENYESPIIQLDKLQEINGNFIILKSPKLVRIEIPNLVKISNELKIHQLTSLSLISFPKLNYVKSLNWKVLPILSNIRFSNEISNVENIRISDTSLIGFTGFQTKTVKNLDINNNRFLEVVNSNVENIQGKLHIVSNAKNMKVHLPNLSTVNNISINDVAELNLSNLTEINESFSLVNNQIANLKLPNLNKVGGTFSLLKNHELQNVDLSKLTEINGGLMLINNTKIKDVSFLKSLQIIDGGLEINGNFKTLIFDNLKLIKGSARIKSSNKDLDCNKIIKDQFNLALRGGKITCEAVGADYGFDDDDDDGTRANVVKQRSWGYKVSMDILLILGGFLFFQTFTS